MKTVTSRENAGFKSLKRLATSTRERRKAGLTLLDGAHLVTAYLASGKIPRQLILCDIQSRTPEIAAIAARIPDAQVLVLAENLFNELAQVASPTGIMALVSAPRSGNIPEKSIDCVMLDGIQDAGNVGSILRSTAAAGIGTVLLSPGCAFAWSSKVLRAGMGAHFALDIHENAHLAGVARKSAMRMVCASSRAGRSLYQCDLTLPTAWVFGSEGGGISAELLETAAEQVFIPIASTTESLNVAAAAAICLFEQLRQRS